MICFVTHLDKDLAGGNPTAISYFQIKGLNLTFPAKRSLFLWSFELINFLHSSLYKDTRSPTIKVCFFISKEEETVPIDLLFPQLSLNSILSGH